MLMLHGIGSMLRTCSSMGPGAAVVLVEGGVVVIEGASPTRPQYFFLAESVHRSATFRRDATYLYLDGLCTLIQKHRPDSNWDDRRNGDRRCHRPDEVGMEALATIEDAIVLGRLSPPPPTNASSSFHPYANATASCSSTVARSWLLQRLEGAAKNHVLGAWTSRRLLHACLAALLKWFDVYPSPKQEGEAGNTGGDGRRKEKKRRKGRGKEGIETVCCEWAPERVFARIAVGRRGQQGNAGAAVGKGDDPILYRARDDVPALLSLALRLHRVVVGDNGGPIVPPSGKESTRGLLRNDRPLDVILG